MLTVVLAILLFAIMIIPHELGHFMVARATGVQVNEFAFGMGPAIFQKQGPETLYSVRIFPIGGYCALEGENEASDNEKAFSNKPWWAKILVLLAGSAMNMVTAVIVLTIVAGIVGNPTTVVDKVEADSPAMTAGIQAGDKILQIGDRKIDEWDQVSEALEGAEGTVSVTVERDGSRITFDATPKEEDGRQILGIRCRMAHDPGAAIVSGVKGTGNMVVLIGSTLKQIFTGEVNADELSGPVGIVSVVHQTRSSGWMFYMYIVALISVNLAVFNLLPFPALDGGRIVFVVIRAVTGRMISDKVEGAFHAAGMVMLLVLMVFVTQNDILRLIR